MHFVDREAKYPNRWTMKKSDGTSEVVTLVRNDEPIVEGTPMNAETLNTLSDVAGAEIARQQAESAREAAAGSATQAAGSASAAEKSKTAAATSERNAAKHEEAAKKYSDEAGAKANTDKTLSIENAPADAKATGDALEGKADKSTVQDESGNAIFYSKAEVEAKIKEILSAQREEDHARIKFWVSDDPTSPAELYGGTWERIEDCTIWGASDTHPAGTTVEAGLPNITGGFSFASYYGAGGWLSVASATGAFKNRNGNGVAAQAGTTVSGSVAVDMDASMSSQIYGNSNTVQPPAYCLYLWRRVA